MTSLTYQYRLLRPEDPERIKRLVLELNWDNPLFQLIEVDGTAIRAAKPLPHTLYEGLFRRGSVTYIGAYHDARDIALNLQERGENAFHEIERYFLTYGFEYRNVLHEAIDWPYILKRQGKRLHDKAWHLVHQRHIQPTMNLD